MTKAALPSPELFGLTRRRLIGGAAALGAASLLTPGRAQAAGRIAVYSTTLPPVQRRMSEAFTRKTGIQVQSLRLPTSPLAQRFLAEQQAGQQLCDVVTLGHDIFFRNISEAGYLAEISDIPGVATLPPAWRSGERFATILIAPQSIGYNTNLVKGDAIPKGWRDLLKPEFKDQIIFSDPRANETVVIFMAALHDAFGDDFFRGLRQQNLRMVPSVPQGIEQVIAGEAKIMLPTLAMNMIQYQGRNAPVAIIPTPSPTSGTYFFSGVVANAPNPEGARLWYEFVLSREGQEILCLDNGISPLGEIPGALKPPADFVAPPLEEAVRRASHLYDLLGLAA